MATQFEISNTAGTLNITIAPGQLNGPGGTARDSDMFLYGQGSLFWGQGVDTNILRLAESFACPDKGELGSPVVITATPQDEDDLGPGKGITLPLDGQVWWNTTAKVLYIYDESILTWVVTSKFPVTPTAPPTPAVGDLWYDLSPGNFCNQAILKVYDPTHVDADVDGWVRVPAEYVNKCGDFMRGELSMADLTGSPVAGSPLPNSIRNKITNLGDPTNNFDATHKQYVDDEVGAAAAGGSASLNAHIADDGVHLTTAQNTFLDTIVANCFTGSPAGLGSPSTAITLANDICDLSGYAINTGTVFTDVDRRVTRDATDNMDIGAFLGLGTSGTPNTPTLNHHATPKSYVDTEVASTIVRTGDDMDVGAFLGLGTSGTPNTPTQNHHATPKNYVDNTIASEVATALSGVGDTLTSSNLTTNGYVRFSNGFAVAWGRNSATSGGSDNYTYDVSLPVIFNGGVYTLVCSIYRSSQPGGGDVDRVGGSFLTTGLIRMWSRQNTAHQMAWIAIGRVV